MGFRQSTPSLVAISDDVTLSIFLNLTSDPRDIARLSCVCKRFSLLISTFICKHICLSTIPSILTDLNPLPPSSWSSLHKLSICCPGLLLSGVLLPYSAFGFFDRDHPSSHNHSSAFSYDQALVQRRGSLLDSHLAAEMWNLCREQGNKLLASRFREDCLYICDWPGCIHEGEKRRYMLFRGVFKNFKTSSVWRTIRDGNRRCALLRCAFCPCKETWDLHSSFCLKRFFGFHDDGEPEVRAFVCENGHVSGAWTDVPLYT